MFIAKVAGTLVSTQKVDAMSGYKLLVVEPYRLEAEDRKSMTTTDNYQTSTLLELGQPLNTISTFGTDAQGELYLGKYKSDTIYRLQPGP